MYHKITTPQCLLEIVMNTIKLQADSLIMDEKWENKTGLCEVIVLVFVQVLMCESLGY